MDVELQFYYAYFNVAFTRTPIINVEYAEIK